MMDKPEHDDAEPARRWQFFDPEAVLYFLLGAVTFAYGTQALVRWALGSWQQGAWLPAAGVMAVAVLLPLAFIVLIRRRVWKLAIGMIWLGVVAYCLALLGFSLPASWFV